MNLHNYKIKVNDLQGVLRRQSSRLCLYLTGEKRSNLQKTNAGSSAPGPGGPVQEGPLLALEAHDLDYF